MSSTPQPTAPRPWWKMTDEEYNQHYRKASDAYYLLPIFLVWIGSIIIYIMLKDEDPKKAKKGAILGVVFTIVFVGIMIGFYAILYHQATIAIQEQESLAETRSSATYEGCLARGAIPDSGCARMYLQ